MLLLDKDSIIIGASGNEKPQHNQKQPEQNHNNPKTKQQCRQSQSAYLLLLCCMISIFVQSFVCTAEPQPTVLLPSVFYWDANNFVYVTPSDSSKRAADIVLRVRGENDRGEKNEVFSETARSITDTHAFKVPVPRLDPRGRPIKTFFVSIQVSGHQHFSTVLAGASDVRQIHLQTDKVFYRPEERVNIRALPLTSAGQLFRGPIQFQLLDPNGFRIFNRTNNANGLLDEESVQLEDNEQLIGDENGEEQRLVGFVAEHFDLPKFLRFGDWQILAFAVDSEGTRVRSSSRFQTSIRITDYEVPKFHVFLDIEEHAGGQQSSPMVVQVQVLARFAHGMAVSGELTLRCLLADPTASGANKVAAVADSKEQQQQQQQTAPPKKLLTAQLTPGSGGRWTGRVDLSGCFPPNQQQQQQQPIQVMAEVFERGTFQSAKTAREWDPFAPGFEMVPLRPAYTVHTMKLQIYLRLLSTLNSIREGRVELISQCISDDRSLNGLNHSLIQRLGTLAELEVDSRCLAYVIRARRQLANGNWSAVEMLVLPLLRQPDTFEFSLIQITANRVDYVEGEVMEARIEPPAGNFTYALLCNNGREVLAVDRVGNDGRILVPITARMRTGPCVLYVHGKQQQPSAAASTEPRTVLDMRLFYVRTSECPDELYEMQLSHTNLSVGAAVNVNLKGRPNSLATLHAFDSRLEALLRPSSLLDPSNGQLWAFTEFLGPDPADHQTQTVDSFAWFSPNVLDLRDLLARRKAVCRWAGQLAPQCPGIGKQQQQQQQQPLLPFQHRRVQPSASRLSQDCLRDLTEECERQKANRESANPFLMPNGGETAGQPPPPPPPEDDQPLVKSAGSIMLGILRRPPAAIVQQTPAGAKHSQEMDDLKALRAGQQQQPNARESTEAEVALRHFFPEVWLFDDFQLGANGSMQLQLRAPHSVTEWRLAPKFWSGGRADVCRLPSQSLRVQRDVFMDVDVYSHIFVNETVPVQVTVSAERLGPDEHRRMAVCFRGLSPTVCGDVGREGGVGETDFTRIELTPENPVQQKRFFVRFLRPGQHNLSFELRAEELLKGHEWHCRDGNIQVFDRIVKQIRVSRRVDLEEHFRQIVVYRRRKIDAVQPTLEQVLGEPEQASVAMNSTPTSFWLLRSTPDVISYSQEQPLDDQEQQESNNNNNGDAAFPHERPVQTKVLVNADGRRVFGLDVEFSKFVASFPPALSTELLAVSSPLASPGQLHRVRNRPAALLNGLVAELGGRMERSADGGGGGRNRKKGGRNGKNGNGKSWKARPGPAAMMLNDVEEEGEGRPLQGYSLPNLLKRLAQASYELKTLRALLTGGGGSGGGGMAQDEAEALLERLDRDWVAGKEQQLGSLLAELLTFSDCRGQPRRACGFGEFGKPTNVEERSLVLTSLATSLLCEQRASDEFICGPITFLAQSVQGFLNGSLPDELWGLESFVQFDNQIDRRLFTEALMVQVALDCSAYACSASSLAKGAWKQLHSSFYRGLDLNAQYDSRVVAALAWMSTPGTRSIMRARLASMTRDDEQVPYWEAGNGKGAAHQNLLEKSFQRSSNVLVNALALLAFTHDPTIFRFWRNEFDLEALNSWLIEQQDSVGQFENALDTFFASRALHQFTLVNAQRQIRQLLTGAINANFTVHSLPAASSQQFTDQELPFTLAIPATVTRMDLESRGDSKLLMGVKVLMEKRKRHRRDPGDREPVSLRLEQRRAQPGFIKQTVTIRTHSHLLRTVQIEHGIFTGFSSFPHFVHISNGPVHFQMEPRVSPTAIHFVLTNLSREAPAVYTVTLMEPQSGYSPNNLAPISISALHHHLPMGQLIVLPEELDFVGAILGQSIGGNGSGRRRRRRRSISPGGLRFPSGNFGSLARPSSAPPPAHFQAADLMDDPQQQQRQRTSAPPQQNFLELVTERSVQPQSEVVETVCLQNGACTCAELSCTLKCPSCDRLTFNELCRDTRGPDGPKFAIFFRITSMHDERIGQAEYTVLSNIVIFEWKNTEVEQPTKNLTIWIRKCNFNCVRMVNEKTGSTKPRFMLIGDPNGLFDESNEDLVETKVGSNRLLQTHYVMRDNDRLIRSTDCYELFGRISDESCPENDGTDTRTEL